MLFNSFEFLIFLPIVFAIYWLGRKNLLGNNIIVVAASYLFYGWWDWRFLFLIFLTTVLSFASGVLIDKYRRRAKLVCGLNIAVNIAILGFFKYFNFFTDNLRIIFDQIGYQLDWFTIDVLLPVGISFYTFQALSYSIDVYRRQTRPTRDFIAFTAFISFFPQLVAGPIERSTQLLPQFLKPRRFDYAEAVDGMRQILWGFFKKLVIADNCAFLANTIFDSYTEVSGSMLALGAIFFTFQIYGDFSGYSDIAVGTAKLFGIRLMRNFNLPYFSRDIGEFWRRWHISLNTWFTDYIYIPLGGSRVSRRRTMLNVMIVFTLSGLWHGANWTFVTWGVYNGLLIIACTLLGIRHKAADITAPGRFLPSLKDAVAMTATFAFVVLGWIVFRAENLAQAWGYISRMFTDGLLSMPDYQTAGIATLSILPTIAFIMILQISEWAMRERRFGLDIGFIPSRLVRWSIYIAILLTLMVFAGSQEKFIYFQF